MDSSRPWRATASPGEAVSMPRVSRRGWTSPRPPARVFSPSAKESSHSLTACRPSTRSTRPSAWVRSPTLRLRVGRDANGGPFDDVRFVPTWDATGRLARMRVRRGARFQTGARLGTVNAFNHSHLNVGWANEEGNPLQFRLTQFRGHHTSGDCSLGSALRGEQSLRRRAIACKCAATTPQATASSAYERAVAQFAEGLP